MVDIPHDTNNDNAVPPAQHPTKSDGTLIPTHPSDRFDKLCEILGKISSKEVDVKAGKLAVLRLALDAGGHLIAIKKNDVVHGKFEPWVKEHLSCTIQTARKYMRLADNRALIEEQIETRFVFSIRGALRLINPKKPARPKHAAVNDPAASEKPYSSEALQKLSPSARAQLSANLPNDIKVEIVTHAVQAQRTADKQENANRDLASEFDRKLAWEFVGAVSKILATQARSECKIEDIKNAFNILERKLPAMDPKLSLHLVPSDFRNATKSRLHS